MSKATKKMYCHPCKMSCWVRIEKKNKTCGLCSRPLSYVNCFSEVPNIG